MELWDTLGQERHSSLVSSYYKNASGVILVYDVTSMESFLNIKSWLIELEEHFVRAGSGGPDQEDQAFLLVGNKSDEDMQRVVRKERGMELAEKYGLAFIETSAMSGKNVTSCFNILANSKN